MATTEKQNRPADALSGVVNVELRNPDARKARAVKECLDGEVSPRHPASILQRHPRATVFLDAPAAALLEKAAR